MGNLCLQSFCDTQNYVWTSIISFARMKKENDETLVEVDYTDNRNGRAFPIMQQELGGHCSHSFCDIQNYLGISSRALGFIDGQIK